MNRDTEWQGEGERERESRGRRENPPSMLSERAIYFHNARSDSFPISPSTRCIVADCALNNSHLLMTLQQAWQHIIDMPIQMDVSALLSAAYGADTQLMVTNVESMRNEKYLLVLALFIMTALVLLELKEEFVIIFYDIYYPCSIPFFLTEGHPQTTCTVLQCIYLQTHTHSSHGKHYQFYLNSSPWE